MMSVRYPITLGIGDVSVEVGWIEAEVAEDIRPVLAELLRKIADEVTSRPERSSTDEEA